MTVPGTIQFSKSRYNLPDPKPGHLHLMLYLKTPIFNQSADISKTKRICSTPSSTQKKLTMTRTITATETVTVRIKIEITTTLSTTITTALI